MATGKIKSNFKMPTPSAAERMNAQHQQVRKAAGLPDPSDYLKMAAQKRKEIEDMKMDQEKEKNPNQGRFSSGASKPVIGTQPLVKSESFRIGGMGSRGGGRGNIYMYDRNPGPRDDDDESGHVPYVPKTEHQKKLHKALTDLGNKLKQTDPRLKESKDSQEYDYEGDMAKSDLRSIMHHAKELHDMLDDDTNLAEWCQSKITLAEDYLSTVANYMRSEMNEGSNFITVLKKGTRMKQKINPNSYAAFKSHGFRKEETEQIDEISSATKASYTSKAKEQIKQSMPYTKKGEEYRDIAKNFIAKRKSGIAKANEAVEQMDEADIYSIENKKTGQIYHHSKYPITKNNQKFKQIKSAGGDHVHAEIHVNGKPMKEEYEQMNELDKSTIQSYVSKKMKNSTVYNPHLNKSYKKDKENLKRAHDRLYVKKANEAVEQMDEARPSQRHPLEGHEYHKKSDEALIHIAKDAHAAAEAMKSHNTDAENKYRDQANDSATVRHFRKTSGMPDWYKKKYGHVNESSHNVPFDKPYKKDTGTTTDKSGAKHTPMSKVRNLAKQAMKKAADRKLQKEAEEPATEPFVKNSKEMSRKAQIVKGASKKGDSFQKEPVLSASVEKNQSTN